MAGIGESFWAPGLFSKLNSLVFERREVSPTTLYLFTGSRSELRKKWNAKERGVSLKRGQVNFDRIVIELSPKQTKSLKHFSSHSRST